MSDEEDLAALVLAHSNLCAKILEMSLNPRPNYNIDGQEVSHGDFLKQLLDARKALRDQIGEDEGPYEIESQMY